MAARQERVVLVAWVALFFAVFASVLAVALAYGMSSRANPMSSTVVPRLDDLREEVIALRKTVEETASSLRQAPNPRDTEQLVRAIEQLREQVSESLASLRSEFAKRQITPERGAAPAAGQQRRR